MDADRHDKRTINDFPPEPRDIFHLMDQVADANGKLQPIDFGVKPGTYDPTNEGQRAIYGRNTWMLWCAGNEEFWDWLAQRGYGVLDFLKIIDSRKRGSRLRDLGLINQPGLKGTDKRGPWGLYIDTVEKRIGEHGEPGQPGYYSPYSDGKPQYPAGPNELQSDGVDPKVYGYPSGVIGLRLFPNPKFDQKAQEWWNADAFYNDLAYANDPRTVRPFLVGASCVVCHIGTHPLNPPKNAEEPEWANLSSLIGNQYFRTSAAFGGRLERGNFLWHFVASQQPGTIDTSMVSTDQINNSNAMNAMFEIPARVARARLNPPEKQGAVAQTLPGEGADYRLFPRVLMDGADSVGFFGALARVYLNIGVYHEEWNRCTNSVIGFTPQRPFSIDVCRRNSVYWRVNENFRMEFLESFLLWEKREGGPQGKRLQGSTAGMHLRNALVPQNGDKPPVKFIDLPENRRHWDEAKAARGMKVFTDHCMVCHSSKQPEGFRIDFAHEPPKSVAKWQDLPADKEKLTLPFSWEHWEDFTKSPAYAEYLRKANQVAGGGDPERSRAFWEENYLSTDLRIPVSLTATNSGRAIATNAMEGEVWSEFASETYKHLPPVGRIRYFDPFSRTEKSYQPQGNGPGYYRVPSLVSIWATAPLLHNNALGRYLPDDDVTHRVSVAGRLEMFDDAIGKLLWKDRRGQTPSGEHGLRDPSDHIWRGGDPGWIFRTDMDSEVRIPQGHIRALVEGVLPGFVPSWLQPVVLGILNHPWVLPLLLALLSAALVLWWPRAFFYLMVLTGIILLALLGLTGIHYLLPGIIWLLPLALLAGGLLWVVSTPHETKKERSRRAAIVESGDRPASAQPKDRWLRLGAQIVRWSGVAAYGLFLVGLLATLWLGREFVDGRLGDLRVGPFPKGMPVNAVMNMNPAAPLSDTLAAVRGLCSTLGKLHDADRLPPAKRLTERQRLEIFEKEAGAALMQVSKCPDFVLDRGHYFGESLTDEEKEALIAFLKTL